jgi:hypothetical protein
LPATPLPSFIGEEGRRCVDPRQRASPPCRHFGERARYIPSASTIGSASLAAHPHRVDAVASRRSQPIISASTLRSKPSLGHPHERRASSPTRVSRCLTVGARPPGHRQDQRVVGPRFEGRRPRTGPHSSSAAARPRARCVGVPAATRSQVSRTTARVIVEGGEVEVHRRMLAQPSASALPRGHG